MNRLLKYRHKFFYGWVIIVFAVIAIFFSSPGQTYSIATFIDAYIIEFGYSRTLIASLYSGATLLSGLLLIVMGKAVDKFGPKRMYIVVGIALFGTSIFSGLIMNQMMIFISFLLLGYLGQGSLPLITGALLPQWFDKRKAYAFSMLSMGSVIGNMFVPAMNTTIIKHFGWRLAWASWGILFLVIFVPLASVFVINRPESVGLLPDNRKVNELDTIQEALDDMKRQSFTLREALKTKTFWLIGLISMIMPLVNTGLMFHIFSILAGKGMDATSTAFVIGLFAFPGVGMPFIAKNILDRFRTNKLLTILFSVITVIYIGFQFAFNTMTVGLLMIVLGFATNILNVLMSTVWVRYFGRLHLGSIRGAAIVFGVVGSALGPLPFAIAYDLIGNYRLILIVMALVTLSGVMMSRQIERPVKA